MGDWEDSEERPVRGLDKLVEQFDRDTKKLQGYINTGASHKPRTMATDRRSGEIPTDELATTIGLYVLGEISLGKAADRIGISRWEMQDLLTESGIEPRLGPTEFEDAEDEIQAIRDAE